MQDYEHVVEVAKMLYQKHADNDPAIHCNRFCTWEELSETSRQLWIEDAQKWDSAYARP